VSAPIRDSQSDRNGAVFWRPGRLWSLWDIMINFNAFGLCNLFQNLVAFEKDIDLRIKIAESNRNHHDASDDVIGALGQVTKTDLDRMRGWLQFSTHLADQLELQGVHDRVEIFTVKLGKLSLQDFAAEIRVLRETFDRGINYRHFYNYPIAKARLVLQFEGDWQPAISAFPQIKTDAFAATDCYALGHNTASVFHSMRVVCGFRRLRPGIPIERGHAFRSKAATCSDEGGRGVVAGMRS
jgi:hypothetical protein